MSETPDSHTTPSIELEEAATMDGASSLQIFWRVVLPLARPALAVTALFSFMTAWNEFILAATLLNDAKLFTLQARGYATAGVSDA